ncbi:MAG: KAP family NTPase [Terricaulis sp.]
MSNKPERPIWDGRDDALDRGRFVTRLVNAVISPAGEATGVVVGLTGEWGSGKSSVLNLLSEEIRRLYPSAFVVRFDPWLVSGRQELIAQFFTEIMATIANEKERDRAAAKDLVEQLAKYARVLAPAAAIANPYAVPVFSTLAHAVATWVGRKEDITKIRNRVERKIAALNGPLVVLVDEVDRVEDNEIRSIAQFVRSVADFPDISYVLAYDPRRVIQALGSGVDDEQREDRGRTYLEKIVQLPISLPILFSEELERLLASELSSLPNVGIPADFEQLPRYAALAERLVLTLIATPRDVKRLVGAFYVLQSMVIGEVDWIDLLGFTTIVTKYPRTLQAIRAHPEHYVDNPLTSLEHNRRMQNRGVIDEQRLIAVLDGKEDTPDLRWLLDHLFPALGKSRSADYVDPISNRRSLFTVLRLGLIPGAASRATVEAMLNSSSQGVVRILGEAVRDDKLSSLMDQLDDVYADRLDIDVDFWRAVAAFLGRHDNSSPEETLAKRSLLDNFSDLLERAVRRNPAQRTSARAIFDDLAVVGDVTLVPAWLRTHMFAHGLFKLNERGGPTWFDAEESEERTRKLCTSWKARFLSGAFLTEIWSLHPIYAILQAEMWDDACRERFTLALGDDKTFDSVLLMMFGGSYSTNREAVEALCSAHEFEQKLIIRSRSDDVQQKPDIRYAIAHARSQAFGTAG